METITKTKISTKIFVGTVILTGLVAGSLVVTALFPGANISMLATATSKPPVTPPVSGWCYTRSGLWVFDGVQTTKEACLKRATDTDPNTKWYAFCPNITGQLPRSSSNCGAGSSDITISPLVEERKAQRDQLIDQVNDGVFSNDDATHIAEFQAVVRLKLACPIIFQIVNLTDPAKKDYEIYGVKGSAEFIKAAGKFFSRMNTKVGDTCQIFPPNCKITSSYRSDASNPDSPHRAGLAMDICCSSQADADSLITKIKGANSGFNIIREATANEKICTGESGCAAIVHLDLKTRNGCGAKSCLFKDLTPCAAGEGEAQGCYGTPPCRGWITDLPSY